MSTTEPALFLSQGNFCALPDNQQATPTPGPACLAVVIN